MPSEATPSGLYGVCSRLVHGQGSRGTLGPRLPFAALDLINFVDVKQQVVEAHRLKEDRGLDVQMGGDPIQHLKRNVERPAFDVTVAGSLDAGELSKPLLRIATLLSQKPDGLADLLRRGPVHSPF